MTATLSLPEWAAYRDYQVNGDSFIVPNLSYSDWLEAKKRILAEMSKFGTN